MEERQLEEEEATEPSNKMRRLKEPSDAEEPFAARDAEQVATREATDRRVQICDGARKRIQENREATRNKQGAPRRINGEQHMAK